MTQKYEKEAPIAVYIPGFARVGAWASKSSSCRPRFSNLDIRRSGSSLRQDGSHQTTSVAAVVPRT